MPLSEQDRENLVAYLDGELDDEATQALEAKLNLDTEARAEVEAMKQAWGLLDYLPRPEPSVNFTHRTMERLALHKPVETARMPRLASRRWLVGVGWAATVLLAVGIGWWGSGFLGPQPAKESTEDEQLVRHLPLIQKMPLYEQVDDLDFLRTLDHPDLFGEETGG